MAQVHYVGLRAVDAADEISRWSVPGLVDWREWDGEMVIRVESTAQTFLLSPLAGEVLKAIRGGAGYLDEIASRVFADCDPASAATAALASTFADATSENQGLFAVLHELRALGLVHAELT